MSKCKHVDKECDECEGYMVNCDDCQHIDEEGDCANDKSNYYLKFVDGLSVCCKKFIGK